MEDSLTKSVFEKQNSLASIQRVFHQHLSTNPDSSVCFAWILPFGKPIVSEYLGLFHWFYVFILFTDRNHCRLAIMELLNQKVLTNSEKNHNEA
jgi:hypothetical protein